MKSIILASILFSGCVHSDGTGTVNMTFQDGFVDFSACHASPVYDRSGELKTINMVCTESTNGSPGVRIGVEFLDRGNCEVVDNMPIDVIFKDCFDA